MDTLSTRAPILAEANRCVACGLCLPHCPTYRKTETEADSPRGRVMLMRGLFEGALDVSDDLAVHLDRCLVCRSCEAACPSGVNYGDLIDAARGELKRRGHQPHGMARWLPAVLSSAPLLRGLGRVRFRERYLARGERRGIVSLFLGCAAQLVDMETLRAGIFVATRLGYEVHVPRGQGCCGAMHQHGGDSGRALELAGANIAAFNCDSLDSPEGERPILFSASGCGASLVEYGRYGEGGAEFSRRAVDIVSFLAQAKGWETVNLSPLDEAVLVHEACTARNVLRNGADSYGLLRRIPKARIVPLPGNDQCCGAAGLYFLSQPEMAARLRTDKMQSVLAGDARILVSTNYGCARWIAKGLRAEGHQVNVMHPVALLAKQMGFTGTC